MIEAIIAGSIRHRVLVLMVTALVAGLGSWALVTTPVDAIPDLSDVQVIVYSDVPGQAPQVVEEQVTYPLSTAMLSVPKAEAVRGFSFFGISMVYVIFEEGTDLYWARSRVLESLSVAKAGLPASVTPQIGPDATGVGWVYQYTLRSDRHDLMELRSIQDWFLRYELMGVPGVAEVASAGGFVKEYQIDVDPELLRVYGLDWGDVRRAVSRSNVDVGGRAIELGETEFMVRGRGYVKDIGDLEAIPLGVDPEGHVPILLKQVASITLGPAPRRGVLDLNGEGEVVSGIVLMRVGANALEVIDGVKERLDAIAPSLPEGVEINTAYDRSLLIRRAIDTLTEALGGEMLIVALVCGAFLLHLRSALVAILTLPLAILISLLLMKEVGIDANIMSLGGIAIAIGVMVDASVVMVENLHSHKGRSPELDHETLVLKAAKEVGPSLFFSLLIITLSFLPVFGLEAQEGRLFAPLAYTKTFAMAASALLAVTVIPVMMFYWVRGAVGSEDANPLSRLPRRLYRPILGHALERPWLALVMAGGLLVVSIIPLGRLGSEFMPPLNEGDLLYMPTTPPGISITKAKELLQQTDKLIATHPQVVQVLGKVGRAETATDPAPLSMIESTIVLAPQEAWPEGKTMEDIIQELDALVQFPGVTNAWTQPIKTRLDMLATGIRTPVGIKLLGEDLSVLSEVGMEIEGVVQGLPGTLSVYSERVVGGNYINIDVRREDAARFGLAVADVNELIQGAVGGEVVTETVEGLARYGVRIRYPRALRHDVPALGRLPIPTPMGHTVALREVADIGFAKGPPMIKSENARRTSWIYVDLNTSDIGAWVSGAKEAIGERVTLPPGVSLLWSGQYEYMERAKSRLRILIPITLGLILILLFIHLGSLSEGLLVMGTLPLALVGGVWLMWLLDHHLSVASAVGFIALAGLAAETGVVMLVYLKEAYSRWGNQGRLRQEGDLKGAVIEGAADRLRPKLMTVTTSFLGLLPVMLGSGTGSRIMGRIAAPMVGGLLSSALLTLIIIPVVYLLLKRRTLNTPRPGDFGESHG